MKSFLQYIKEKHKPFLRGVDYDSHDTLGQKLHYYTFKHGAHEVEVLAQHSHDNPKDHEVSFSVNSRGKGEEVHRTGKVGAKNARQIIKKVGKAVRVHIKKHPDASISFSSDERRSDNNRKKESGAVDSRTKIYKRLATKVARRKGRKLTMKKRRIDRHDPELGKETKFTLHPPKTRKKA